METDESKLVNIIGFVRSKNFAQTIRPFIHVVLSQ
jgi:hypothetical protein